MALQLSVSQSGGKLRVYATNNGDHAVIIDTIVLAIEASGWSWFIWKYSDDFYFGSGRVGAWWGGLMFEIDYSSGPANAHATADYFEVDQRIKSPAISIV